MSGNAINECSVNENAVNNLVMNKSAINECTTNEMDSQYRYWLASQSMLSAREKLFLIKKFGNEEEVFKLSENVIGKLQELTPAVREALRTAQKDASWHQAYENFRKQRITLVCWKDSEYPEKLREIYDPPYCLFVKGELPPPDKKAVAVVGARGCSAYGEAVACNIGKQLALCGVSVISGLALGIDGAAHRGALEGKGATFAVMGCGVDVCYPASHRKLYGQICEEGGVLSEFAVGSQPRQAFFPIRNRIISGLADAVVVVEARPRSGSLITADRALEQGRMVYAVPGRISDSLSSGTNWLLSQGAAPFFSMEEFLKDLGICGEKEPTKNFPNEIPLAKSERLVYSVLDLTPKFLECIIEETGLDFAEAMNAVYSLVECGCAKEIYKNHYVRTNF